MSDFGERMKNLVWFGAVVGEGDGKAVTEAHRRFIENMKAKGVTATPKVVNGWVEWEFTNDAGNG